METQERMMNIVRDFIVEDALHGQGDELTFQTPLLQWGIIDSLQMLSLVAFIEHRFSVKLPDASINAKNFQTIESVVSLISSIEQLPPG